MRKLMLRSLLTIAAGLAMVTSSVAQSSLRLDVPGSWSLGFTAGMSDLWGDVGTKSIIDHYNNGKYFNSPRFMGGIFTRFAVSPCFAMRLSANYGSLYATDAWNYEKATKAKTENDDAYQRYARYQDARDIVFEGNLLFEFNPLRMNPESKVARRAAQPYIFAGIGYYHFQPYSSLDGKWVKTYDLHLEGDGLGAPYPPKYSLAQFCIPLGIGYKFDIGPHLNLGVEYMYRFCFTDYLDGVSNKYIDTAVYSTYLNPQQAAEARQLSNKTNLSPGNSGFRAVAGQLRGNPNDNDSYSTISIIFYYKVKNHKIPFYE